MTLNSKRRDKIIDELIDDMDSWELDGIVEYAKFHRRQELEDYTDDELLMETGDFDWEAQ